MQPDYHVSDKYEYFVEEIMATDAEEANRLAEEMYSNVVAVSEDYSESKSVARFWVYRYKEYTGLRDMQDLLTFLGPMRNQIGRGFSEWAECSPGAPPSSLPKSEWAISLLNKVKLHPVDRNQLIKFLTRPLPPVDPSHIVAEESRAIIATKALCNGSNLTSGERFRFLQILEKDQRQIATTLLT